MTWPLWVGLVTALVGSPLAGVLLTLRYANRKTAAEAARTFAEAGKIVGDDDRAWLDSYRKEINAQHDAILKLQADAQTCEVKLAATLAHLAALQVELETSTARVARTRDEVMHLQDQLDRNGQASTSTLASMRVDIDNLAEALRSREAG